MRLFLSYHPTPDEVVALQRWQRDFRHAMESQTPHLAEEVRWTKSSQFHLTIEFFGEVKTDERVRLEQAIALAAGPAESAPVTIDGVGSFPVYRAPQVLWFRVHQSEQLMNLQRQIRIGLLDAGYHFETGYFPHVTMGRLKKTKGITSAELDAFCALVDRFTEALMEQPVVWPGREIALMQSRPASGGPQYTCLQTFTVGTSS